MASSYVFFGAVGSLTIFFNTPEPQGEERLFSFDVTTTTVVSGLPVCVYDIACRWTEHDRLVSYSPVPSSEDGEEELQPLPSVGPPPRPVFSPPVPSSEDGENDLPTVGAESEDDIDGLPPLYPMSPSDSEDEVAEAVASEQDVRMGMGNSAPFAHIGGEQGPQMAAGASEDTQDMVHKLSILTRKGIRKVECRCTDGKHSDFTAMHEDSYTDGNGDLVLKKYETFLLPLNS
ncbi:hypothetical protein B0H12DRAFT_1234880 [Mycena haematopus]|nr:hypothetical protein B0H12DRAFT_1241155 [Mycena haematopus]KAJ7248909.1 hypothetical protein B0H12DRAFT_1234880 [Mycena haematopus]